MFDGKASVISRWVRTKAAYGSGNFYALSLTAVYLKPLQKKFHRERKALEQELMETLV